MNKEEILTWLARNVHKWPENGSEMRDGFVPGSQYYGPDFSEIVWCKGVVTKRQWLARRAELQNKPSWADAPEWATHIAQRYNGRWLFLKCGELGEVAWKANKISDYRGPSGEVLGDWRDTLEQRPFEPFVSVEDAPTPITAHSILEAAGGHMRDRAATYDKPEGERSMGATVEAFRAITGHKLTEEQGWLFMQLLKAVRSQQGAYRADSYEDGAAYVALAGEAAARERGGAR